MGILVECPKCKVRGSVKRKVCKCGNQVQKSDSKNYWIDYYINGKRTRERIGRSKQAWYELGTLKPCNHWPIQGIQGIQVIYI